MIGVAGNLHNSGGGIMFGLFAYIRRQVADAFVGGVADGLERVEAIDWTGTPAEVRLRLVAPPAPGQVALPAADDEAEPVHTNGRRKVRG